MRTLTRLESIAGGGILASVIACIALAAWAAQLSGRPVAIRNESGGTVEIVPVGTTRDRLHAIQGTLNPTPMIRLAAGARTELAYDFERSNLCWFVVFVEGGDARLVRTTLAHSHPDECSIETTNTRPCCTPLPQGKEIVIPPLRDLAPVPSPILNAANRAQ